MSLQPINGISFKNLRIMAKSLPKHVQELPLCRTAEGIRASEGVIIQEIAELWPRKNLRHISWLGY